MTEYRPPKLDGNKVALRCRVTPEEHRVAHDRADSHHLTLAEYIAALINREAGRPSKLDADEEQKTLSLDP